MVDNTTELSGTEIQGMMMGCYDEGAEVKVAEGVKAVCLDGEVWEVQDSKENVLGTVNPTVAPCGCEIEDWLTHILQGECAINYRAVLTFDK